MRAKLIFIFLIFIISNTVFAQNIPIIKTGEKQIAVKKLNVDVTVFGDIAITTYDMQFYNPNFRVLEGELSFPLEENQSVVRFALDINGTLREAVVVEQEKARVAFENTVRQKIDPALLEKTKGNNYKARIYPIPAKGYKRVVVAFQQKLIVSNEAYYYKIPFNYKKKLHDFSFSMKVLNQKNKPVFIKGFKKDFQYDRNKEAHSVKITNKRQEVIQTAIIRIPLNTNRQRVIVNDDYFYVSKHINFDRKEEALEKEITIFWDKSLSQKDKNIKTEISFLDEYFRRVPNCNVKLVMFNTKIRAEKSYDIINGNWQHLKQKLENTVYDGASSFSFFNSYQDHSKVNLVFTDGLNTLSKLNINLLKKTHIINNAISANHNTLKAIAAKTSGIYINLQQSSIQKAFDEMTSCKIQFLGSNISKSILEIYPKKGTSIQNSFSFSGKGKVAQKKIQLYFGSATDTLKTISFSLKNNSENSFIKKIWAQKKLEFLSENKEENENEIVTLSKEYQIISDFTSMLILDRVEDYVTHRIEPPRALKMQYDRLIAQKVNDKKERLARLRHQIFDKYSIFFSWYRKDYHPKIKKNLTNSTVRDTLSITTNTNGVFTVSGIVSGDNQTLPSVSVILNDTYGGTLTDFDGKYAISVKKGDILKFSYLGFISKAIVIENQRTLNVTLDKDESVLDEVVVVGYTTQIRRNVTESVSSVKAQNINNAQQGSVAGVQSSSNNSSEASTNITIRGASSLKNKSNALYVVDGTVVHDISQLNVKDIESTYLLNASQAAAIYGNSTTNGVVVITTKKESSKHSRKIADFEKLVTDKVELKGWNPKTPYLKVLKPIKNVEEAYTKYVELREQYQNSPSFYIDVADFFKERNERSIAIQILTNAAEIELDNYELLRALAYKFEEYKLFEYAVFVYQEIVKLRPEDIQSYRDLALAYEEVHEYQKSLDILYKIVNGTLLLKDEQRRYKGIEVVALNEMNRLITMYSNQLKTSHIEKKWIKDLKTDIRVVIDWNHNDTDIDLWVIDPNKEKCYYSHKETEIGGLLSDDMTEGFGPEQFVIKNAITGKFKIKAKYFSDSKQKISGPTFLKVTVFKNYAKQHEAKFVKLVRLKSEETIVKLGEIEF